MYVPTGMDPAFAETVTVAGVDPEVEVPVPTTAVSQPLPFVTDVETVKFWLPGVPVTEIPCAGGGVVLPTA